MKKLTWMTILAASTVLLGLANAASREQEPWYKWARNPLDVPVTLVVTNIYAETNTSVSVSFAGREVVQEGYDCATPTNASPLKCRVKLRREYQLTVVGTNLASLDIQFQFQANWTPLTRTGRASQPRTFHLLVDRMLNPGRVINAQNGYCTYYSNTWTIELTERLPVNWRQEDGSDDPLPAPGDGGWAELGPGRDISLGTAALNWSVSLGRLKDGLAAGRLTLRENGLSPEIYTPTNLYFTAGAEIIRDQVELVMLTTNCPVLRQVKAHQAFVDIVALTNATELRFYQPTQVGAQTNEAGWYTNLSGIPFVIWVVANPEPATTNKLNIVECRPDGNRTNEIIFDPGGATASWTLRYGVAPTQRLETRNVQITAGGGVTNRIEVVDIRYGGVSLPAYRATETYRLFPWGFELVEVRQDPDNNPNTSDDLVRSIAFNTDTNCVYSYGRPDTFVHPDGYWEKYLYGDDPAEWDFGLLRWVLTPDRDVPSDPTQATIENSMVRKFWRRSDYSVWDYADLYKGTDWFTRGVKSTVQDRHTEWGFDMVAMGFWDQKGAPGYGIIEDDAAFVGELSHTFGEDWGYGYYRHTAFEFDGETYSRVSYYHGGTYDPQTRSFTVGTNAIWAEPDFRQCTIHAGDYGNDGDMSAGIQVSQAEGQQLYGWGFSAPYVYTNRSWRESFIYQKGSLVQREMHVLTGVMETNGVYEPLFDRVCYWVCQNDSLGHATNVTWVDGASGVSRVVYSANYRGTNSFDGELLCWEEDAQGARTSYTYDSLKRRTGILRAGVSAGGGFPAQSDITTVVVYDAQGQVLTNRTSAGSLDYYTSAAFDLAGRPTMLTDTNGLTSTFLYELAGRKITQTRPDSSTEIRETYLDRRLKSVTGTGVVNEWHDWFFGLDDSFKADPFMVDIAVLHTIQTGSSSSPRKRSEGLDWGGRVVQRASLDWGGNTVAERRIYQWEANAWTKSLQAILRSVGDSFVVQTWYDRDIDGGASSAAVPVAETRVSQTYGIYGVADSVDPSPGGVNRVQRTFKYFARLGGHWFQCVTNVAYRAENNPTPSIVSVQHERLSGFPSSAELTEVISWDADTNTTVATTYLDRQAKKVTTVVNSPQSTLDATNIVINSLLQLESTSSVAAPTRHYYDALGRRSSTVSPLGFTATTTYDGSGQVSGVTDFTGATVVYEYYPQGSAGAGRLKCETRAGKKTRYSYTPRGELYRTWGDVPYPEERSYGGHGELVTLNTYRGGAGWNGSAWPASPGQTDTTTWVYQEHSGLLTNKTDAAGRSVSYTYTNGWLWTRSWARGITSTNLYNHLGELLITSYSDSTPPVYFAYTNGTSEVLGFNRSGQRGFVSDGSGAWHLVYDHAGRLTATTCSNGLLSGVIVSNRFDGLYGRDQIRVAGVSPALTHDYRYDAASGRLGVVSNGIYSATYDYLPDSDLLRATTCKSNSTTILTTTRAWECGLRLAAIINEVNGINVSSHSYLYDTLNRRTQATLEDGSIWKYGYNDRNELISAKRFWPDWSSVAGQQSAYLYDSIGNRQKAWSGGDTNGSNLHETLYTANNLNQYSDVQTPGLKHISGVAFATNGVSVNSAAAERHGEWFDKEIAIGNSSGPVWQTVSVTSGTVTSNGGFVFPKNQQNLTYDLDGNLTFDGIWTYEWDGENRLRGMSMTNVSGIPNAQRTRLDFAYDLMSRRVLKVVSAWTGAAFAVCSTNLFVYDLPLGQAGGWNLLAILDPELFVQHSFLWGQDLSGTLDQAGGVGGLLMFTTHGVSSTNCFVACDGSGNVTALLNAGSGLAEARYEHSPFGESIRTTGSLARANPFRWSSKFWDDESGLVYYGFRYYDGLVGRWIGRDPAAERGGANLYLFANNSPLCLFDTDGRWPTTLAQWTGLGVMADTASTLHNLSGAYGAIGLELMALTISLRINSMTSGALLQNIGGAGNFAEVGLVGLALRLVPGSYIKSQSWGYAIVNGRLQALAAVGQAAGKVLRGASPDDVFSAEGLAYSFVQRSRRGDTAYADLDAALLGMQIGFDNVDPGKPGNSLLTYNSLFWCLKNGDAAGMAANLPSYMALNAWDMLAEIESSLEGL